MALKNRYLNLMCKNISSIQKFVQHVEELLRFYVTSGSKCFSVHSHVLYRSACTVLWLLLCSLFLL